MYDYVDGKADWMAYGLPVEGDDGPFLGQALEAVPTCAVSATVADARRVLGPPGAPAEPVVAEPVVAEVVVVVDADGRAIGEVGPEALAAHADDVALLEVMDPVPTTVRPSVTVASLAAAGGGRRLVTTSDGRLLGRATVAPSTHQEHRHDHGHAHDGDAGDEAHDEDDDRFEAEMAAVLEAVEERFGDREPSAQELREFLRDRLVSEGRTAEEAERFLDQLDTGEAE